MYYTHTGILRLIILAWTIASLAQAGQGEKPGTAPKHIAQISDEVRQIKQAVEKEKIEHERDNQRILAAIAELEKNEWMNQLLASGAGILGTVIGGSLAFWFSLVFYRRQVRQETRNLEGAFAGEISAIVAIVVHRQYIQHLQQSIQSVQQHQQPVIFGFVANEEYFSVYRANASRLGLLPDPLPELIAGFYTNAFSILEDARRMATPGFNFPNAQTSLHALQNMLALLQTNETRANQILQIISSRRQG